MSLRNRLLRMFNEEHEERHWKRLTAICSDEPSSLRHPESRRLVFEQKLEKIDSKSVVKFNKLVEVKEYQKAAPTKLSKLGELASIAMDLKKE